MDYAIVAATLVVVLTLALKTLGINQEYERAVLFRLGRLGATKGPGKYRNLVERFFNKIKHFRAVATRYDKDPDNFLASVKLAALRVWLRAL